MGMYENLKLWDGMSMRILLYVAGHPGQTKSEIIKTVGPEHNRMTFLKLQGLIESGYLRPWNSPDSSAPRGVTTPT